MMPADKKLIRGNLQQFINDLRYLDKRWGELTSKHPGRWIGVHRRQAVLADSLEAVLDASLDRGWSPGDVVVRRLVTARPPVVL